MAFTTPVALMVFNRPSQTRLVFERVREQRPVRLLVVADGPRPDRPGEAERCAAVRDLVTAVDWPCQLSTNFADANMGCRDRITSGIDWIFEVEEEAIIIEDDCLPHPTFFRFCAELLRRYEDDERVMAVSGDNFQFGQVTNAHSYYFSRYFHCWGWATWRRAWRLHDVGMPFWPELRNDGWLEHLINDPVERAHWRSAFDAVGSGALNTWDYQWVYSIWRQSALTILPHENLVSNIGAGAEATHTTGADPFMGLPSREMPFPLRHPPHVVRDFIADAAFARRAFGPQRRHFW